MLKGFRDYIMRGNVVDLATAVVVGAAFTAIVTSFTQNIVNPLIAAIPHKGCGQAANPPTEPTQSSNIQGPAEFCGFGVRIVNENAATFIDFGAVLSTTINFVIVASVVYFLIVAPVSKLASLGGLEPGSGKSEEAAALAKIQETLESISGNLAGDHHIFGGRHEVDDRRSPRHRLYAEGTE
ncbi:MscL family protein [Gordonia malaquae]|uniref:large conductance mechanosensitive channel protein MscL n=1 Tax=Gordonia malaquae TaxID=410332 RepID=UPI0030FF158C